MIKRLVLILNCSRIFSLPMTIFSWLIIFVYSALDSGNIFYGLICLLGLSFAHLATNLTDDYFDYKFLIKQVGFDKNEYLKNSQKTKCRYLIAGLINEKQLIMSIVVLFFLAFLSGLYLFFKCGVGIFYFALAGGFIGVMYPFLSRFYMSELAVALAYGPALFGGVYYAMTGIYSTEAIILSIPSMFMTVVLLYVHSVMDYSFDINEGKLTVANSFNSQLDSLVVLKYLFILAYSAFILFCIFDILDWQIFFVLLTIPLALDLYNSMREFALNPESVPQKKWYHFPMENLNMFKERGEASFMFRMFQSRNLMIYFSLFIVAIMLFTLWL